MNRGLPEETLRKAAQAAEEATYDGNPIGEAAAYEAIHDAIPVLAPAIEEAVEARVREELLAGLEKARQGHVRHGEVRGDLFGNTHDKDPDKARLAERRMYLGVGVVALKDVNAAIDAALDTPEADRG